MRIQEIYKKIMKENASSGSTSSGNIASVPSSFGVTFVTPGLDPYGQWRSIYNFKNKKSKRKNKK